MQKITKQKIQNILEKTNRRLTLNDFELIQKLDLIAESLKGECRKLDQCKDWTTISGRCFLFPTFARAEAMERVLAQYRFVYFQVLGCLYVLDPEHSPADFTQVPSRFCLVRYAGKIDVNIDQARSFIEGILNPVGSDDTEESDQVENETQSFDGDPVHRICCVLAQEVGGSVSEWMDAPQGRLQEGLRLAEEKRDAEVERFNALYGKGGGAPRVTPKISKLAEFHSFAREIETLWLSEASQ